MGYVRERGNVQPPRGIQPTPTAQHNTVNRTCSPKERRNTRAFVCSVAPTLTFQEVGSASLEPSFGQRSRTASWMSVSRKKHVD